jgi:hypothetical protein
MQVFYSDGTGAMHTLDVVERRDGLYAVSCNGATLGMGTDVNATIDAAKREIDYARQRRRDGLRPLHQHAKLCS